MSLQSLINDYDYKDRVDLRAKLKTWALAAGIDGVASELTDAIVEADLANPDACPPRADMPMPADLCDPQTLLAAAQRLQIEAEKKGNETRANACAALRLALLKGGILKVAGALIDAYELIETEIMEGA